MSEYTNWKTLKETIYNVAENMCGIQSKFFYKFTQDDFKKLMLMEQKIYDVLEHIDEYAGLSVEKASKVIEKEMFENKFSFYFYDKVGNIIDFSKYEDKDSDYIDKRAEQWERKIKTIDWDNYTNEKSLEFLKQHCSDNLLAICCIESHKEYNSPDKDIGLER